MFINLVYFDWLVCLVCVVVDLVVVCGFWFSLLCLLYVCVGGGCWLIGFIVWLIVLLLYRRSHLVF